MAVAGPGPEHARHTWPAAQVNALGRPPLVEQCLRAFAQGYDAPVPGRHGPRGILEEHGRLPAVKVKGSQVGLRVAASGALVEQAGQLGGGFAVRLAAQVEGHPAEGAVGR